MLSDRKFYYAFFLIFTLFFGESQAEILKVHIDWQPETCTANCARLLAEKFQKVQGVAEITMNQPGGYAELRWKPRYPFNFNDIQTAMQLVGVGIRTIRVKVRGTILFQAQSVALVSLGDNTPFYLLGQLVPQPNQQVQYESLQNHQLSPSLLTQLSEGAKQNRIAVIDGSLYLPWNYSWLWLIVEQIQFVQPEAA